MKDAVENAIKLLVERSSSTNDGGDAMRYSQAALNLAHTAQVMSQVVEK